jgi:hypothetical protein
MGGGRLPARLESHGAHGGPIIDPSRSALD